MTHSVHPFRACLKPGPFNEISRFVLDSGRSSQMVLGYWPTWFSFRNRRDVTLPSTSRKPFSLCWIQELPSGQAGRHFAGTRSWRPFQSGKPRLRMSRLDCALPIADCQWPIGTELLADEQPSDFGLGFRHS